MYRRMFTHQPTLFALALFATLTLATGCSTLGASSSRASMRDTITVSGIGGASGSPDLAQIELGVDIVSENPADGVSEANRVMDQVIAALGEEGIAPEDIQTTGLNLWWDEIHNETESGLQIERRYHTQNIARITVRDVDATGTIIQAGLDAGANQLHSLNFRIEDTSSLEQEAREKAYDNARARATELAEAAGVTLGKPVIISEGFDRGDGPIPFAEEAAFAIGGGGPPVSGGQMNVVVQLNVTYEIR